MDSVIFTLLFPVVGSIILNLIFSAIFNAFATDKQKNAPNGNKNLGFGAQIVNIFVQHHNVPVTSSLMLFILLSITMGLQFLIQKLLL